MMFSSLFTSSSKMKKRILQILSVLLFVGTFALIVHGLNRIYVDDYIESNNRRFWHNYYSYNGEIDSLCVGSSHVCCDIDPDILDRLSGYHFFDMSTTAQRMNGSYYMIREAVNDHPVKRVYLELYYGVTTEVDTETGKEDRIDGDLFWSWRNTDYMKPSFNRLAYQLTMTNPERYPEVFLPFVRYRSQLFTEDHFNIDLVRNSLSAKRSEEYRSYGEVGSTTPLRKGFQCSEQTIADSERTHYPNIDLGKRRIGPKTEAYIRKIADYCRKKDIELTFFISPMDRLQLMATGNYDAYHQQVAALAAELQVPFYDFNLAREEYLDVFQPGQNLDFEHMNQYGAAVYTPFFWQVVSGQEEQNAGYFYSSFSEALAQSPAKVYGIYGTGFAQDADGRWFRFNKIASNHASGMYYRISVQPDDGEPYLFQDYSVNDTFSLCVEGSGTITIDSVDETTGNVQVLELNYRRP